MYLLGRAFYSLDLIFRIMSQYSFFSRSSSMSKPHMILSASIACKISMPSPFARSADGKLARKSVTGGE